MTRLELDSRCLISNQWLPRHGGVMTTELILDPTSGSVPWKILHHLMRFQFPQWAPKFGPKEIPILISTWMQCTLPLPRSRQWSCLGRSPSKLGEDQLHFRERQKSPGSRSILGRPAELQPLCHRLTCCTPTPSPSCHIFILADTTNYDNQESELQPEWALWACQGSKSRAFHQLMLSPSCLSWPPPPPGKAWEGDFYFRIVELV